jgi:hypothetical protein
VWGFVNNFLKKPLGVRHLKTYYLSLRMPYSLSYLSVAAAGALLAKAIAAVNGPVASGKEGHLGVLAALGADCGMHFARA